MGIPHDPHPTVIAVADEASCLTPKEGTVTNLCFHQEPLPMTRMNTNSRLPYFARYDKLSKVWHVIIAESNEPLEDEYGDVYEFANGTDAHLQAWSLIVTSCDEDYPEAREQEDLWFTQWEEEERLRSIMDADFGYTIGEDRHRRPNEILGFEGGEPPVDDR